MHPYILGEQESRSLSWGKFLMEMVEFFFGEKSSSFTNKVQTQLGTLLIWYIVVSIASPLQECDNFSMVIKGFFSQIAPKTTIVILNCEIRMWLWRRSLCKNFSYLSQESRIRYDQIGFYHICICNSIYINASLNGDWKIWDMLMEMFGYKSGSYVFLLWDKSNIHHYDHQW